jgi:hypothetical protein
LFNLIIVACGQGAQNPLTTSIITQSEHPLMKNVLTFWFIVLSFAVLLSGRNQAQSSSQTLSVPSLENIDTTTILRHHAGWGVSWVEGDATLGRDEGEFLLSTFYGYSLSKNTTIELSLQYLPVQRFYSIRELSSPNDSLTTGFTSLSFYSDVSFFAENFSTADFWKSLRIGGGISLRTTTMMLMPNAHIVNFANPNVPFVKGVYRDVRYSQRFNAGFNLKAEYSFPLSKALELTVRGQLHLLPIRINTNNTFGSATVGSLSLGGFLRFNW